MHHRRSIAMLAAAFIAATTTVVCAQTLPTATPESVGMSSERLGRIGTALKAEIDQGRIPGAVVMIARRGKLVYSETFGYRDKAAGVPMTSDTIFRIYSMTKPLVSVAAMMLVEEGKLQLTDLVSKYLPSMKSMQVSVAQADAEFAKVTYSTVSAARDMTVQDLLRHTAGLAYGEITQNAPVKKAYLDAGIFKTTIEFDARDLTPAEQVERLAKAPLAHQPGTVWDYSLASDVLGRVVEAASGKRLGEFMDERLFRPMGMVDAAFWVPPAKLPRLAQPLAVDPVTGNAIHLIDVSAIPAADSGGAGGVADWFKGLSG